MMKNLCAKFGCHMSSNKRDKQGAESAPPPGIECFKSPRSDRVKENQVELSALKRVPKKNEVFNIIWRLHTQEGEHAGYHKTYERVCELRIIIHIVWQTKN